MSRPLPDLALHVVLHRKFSRDQYFSFLLEHQRGTRNRSGRLAISNRSSLVTRELEVLCREEEAKLKFSDVQES